MGRAVLLLLLSIGVEVAVGGNRKILNNIKAEVTAQGQQIAQIIELLDAQKGECAKTFDLVGSCCSGNSPQSPEPGNSPQSPEPGTDVQGVCPKTHETETTRTTCHDVETGGASGAYTVNIGGQEKRVYCDMATDGGGWIVVQRRMDGSVDFLRNWANYADGFGDVTGEFWLGNELLHKLTSSGTYELRVDLADRDGNCAYATFSDFHVASAADNYKLDKIGDYAGDAGNSMAFQLGQMFTTIDQDHDTRGAENCAQTFTGAWWYANCHASNLNGAYGDNNYGKGVIWFDWKGHQYSLSFSEMKIRPTE